VAAMFSKIKGAMSKAKGGGGAGSADKAEKERLAKEAREAALLAKQEETQMKLLPWEFKDFVKMALFMVIKLPFILCVGLLATVVEIEVKAATTRSWHRPTSTTGPSCFVTELHREILNYNTSLNELALKAGLGPLYNETALIKGNASKWINLTLTETDRCGLLKDHCAIDPDVLDEEDLVEDHGWFNMGSGGIQFGVFFPFASLWMLYKLVWIPLWPVDRIAQKLAGNVHPPPQPIFRLVTQPYFQRCTGALDIAMMILNMLRYVFLPNYLLLPLTTLVVLDNCEKHSTLIHYQMDWLFGQAAYIWLVVDFFTVIAAYLFFQFVYGGRAIGTWAYRLYKFYWLTSSFTAITLFVCNLVATFDTHLFGGLNFAFQMVLDFNVFFRYSIDMLAFMAGANYVMEGLSMTYTIGGLLLPLVLRKIPCCKSCMERFDAKTAPASKHSQAEEGRSLLGGHSRH